MKYNKTKSIKMPALNLLRDKIDVIDKNIIILVAQRLKITTKIQKIKKILEIPINQKKREKFLLEKYLKYAQKKGIRADTLIIRLFQLLFSYAKKNGTMK